MSNIFWPLLSFFRVTNPQKVAHPMLLILNTFKISQLISFPFPPSQSQHGSNFFTTNQHQHTATLRIPAKVKTYMSSGFCPLQHTLLLNKSERLSHICLQQYLDSWSFHTDLIMLYNKINMLITSFSSEDNVLISGVRLHGLPHAARSHI